MIGRFLTTASLWVAAPIWHLWNLARMQPVYGSMGNNQRSETMMVSLLFAAATLRHLIFGEPVITAERSLAVLVSVMIWFILIVLLCQSVLKAVVRFFPSEKERKDFIDVATLQALGCSVVIDLFVSMLCWLTGDPLDSGFTKLAFLVMEVALIICNVTILCIQAKAAVYVQQMSAKNEELLRRMRRAELSAVVALKKR